MPELSAPANRFVTNKIPCLSCGHLIEPDARRCGQCGEPRVRPDYRETAAGRTERLLKWVVGYVAAIGFTAILLIVYFNGPARFRRTHLYYSLGLGALDLASYVEPVADESFQLASHASGRYRFEIPSWAVSARVGGVVDVDAGRTVDLYIMSEEELARWEKPSTGGRSYVLHEKTRGMKLKHYLSPGAYYLVFDNKGDAPVNITARLTLKHD